MTTEVNWWGKPPRSGTQTRILEFLEACPNTASWDIADSIHAMRATVHSACVLLVKTGWLERHGDLFCLAKEPQEIRNRIIPKAFTKGSC